MENVRAAVDTARRAVSRRDARRRLPMNTIVLASALGVFLALYPNAALAQNGRSYVSRFGSDANNCQLATPCRGFLTALANTTNGGIINCLDSGDFFGPGMVSKSITIDCIGHAA